MNTKTEITIFGSLWALLVFGVASIIAGIWLNDWRWTGTGLVVGVSAMITLMAITL